MTRTRTTKTNLWCVVYQFNSRTLSVLPGRELKCREQDDDHHVDHATPPIGEFVQSTPHFRPYKSLLGNFPLACTRLGVSVESTHDTSHDPSTALVDINSAQVANLRSGQVINNLALINVLVDPNQRLCQYEVPGGGKCRDATCTDVHLDRLLHSATTGTSCCQTVLVVLTAPCIPFILTGSRVVS
jgi:hypothetical protein